MFLTHEPHMSLHTATYLINRIPSPLLHDLTPFQMLLGKPPSYVHLRSFGCLCYASTLARDRPNLVPRPRLVFFLVILLVLKVTSFMIWLLGHVLSPGMLSSKSLVFLLNIGLLNPLLFLISHLLIQCFHLNLFCLNQVHHLLLQTFLPFMFLQNSLLLLPQILQLLLMNF